MAWPDELVEKPILLHAHQSHLYWSAAGDRMQAPPLPFAVSQGSLVGPLLIGLSG